MRIADPPLQVKVRGVAAVADWSLAKPPVELTGVTWPSLVMFEKLNVVLSRIIDAEICTEPAATLAVHDTDPPFADADPVAVGVLLSRL